MTIIAIFESDALLTSPIVPLTHMFELALLYKETGMSAYSNLQQAEFAYEAQGYHAIKHQSFVGTGYFDAVAQTIAGGVLSTGALKGSTEEEQFEENAA